MENQVFTRFCKLRMQKCWKNLVITRFSRFWKVLATIGSRTLARAHNRPTRVQPYIPIGMQPDGPTNCTGLQPRHRHTGAQASRPTAAQA